MYALVSACIPPLFLRRTWGAFILAIADFSTLSTRLEVANTLVRLACAIALDVLWLTLQSRRNPPTPPDATFLIFVVLFTCHWVSFWVSARTERSERDAFSIQRALETAVRERRALLEDLFPPAVVRALVTGEPVRPLVTEGAVVLYCDLVGFTRMCSALEPLEIMRAMNEVYSVFE